MRDPDLHLIADGRIIRPLIEDGAAFLFPASAKDCAADVEHVLGGAVRLQRSAQPRRDAVRARVQRHASR